GIGLREKIRSYALQDHEDVDTFEANRRLGHAADGRNYVVAAEMLAALGLQKISLLTNNPDKVRQLRAGGLDVKRVPTGTHLTSSNTKYLRAKKNLAGHLLDIGFTRTSRKVS
ncbi:MAG: GTP cyclohydrolase, partial [Alphaproteobacteria bacterium]|nr:GTP cyclohydrolase [Alphaproteobacteria bacterium]